jgi:hypothetical protein
MMAGIFDEVMDGITAKEKQEGTPAKTAEPAAPPAQEQEAKQSEGGNPMNNYSDTFKKQYGEKK